ncbi:MAG: hypothetical protein OXE77_09350 [Flavobacteriaceae bacterium]|nr:hypothetical protein [Flavobacteriaceae bacterium]MCY4266863.1 hypothetical protein [Flavobacteriaceae bacterium]MCY4297999.1 hypothetical protein [Flavobacteriaceae bacterium]
MDDTVDLPFLEVAGISMVMLVTMFIEEVNPWITVVLGISGISWLVYRFFLSRKESKISDARELRAKEKHQLEMKILRNKLKSDSDNDRDDED